VALAGGSACAKTLRVKGKIEVMAQINKTIFFISLSSLFGLPRRQAGLAADPFGKDKQKTLSKA
jgi:hypothetical protein